MTDRPGTVPTRIEHPAAPRPELEKARMPAMTLP
jgi:hypothetical protein